MPNLRTKFLTVPVKPALMLLPPGAPPGDVGAILLAGVQAFF